MNNSGGRGALLLVVMCHEGDNSREAALAAKALLAALHLGDDACAAAAQAPMEVFGDELTYGASHALSSY